MILSAHIEQVSVSRMQDLLRSFRNISDTQEIEEEGDFALIMLV